MHQTRKHAFRGWSPPALRPSVSSGYDLFGAPKEGILERPVALKEENEKLRVESEKL